MIRAAAAAAALPVLCRAAESPHVIVTQTDLRTIFTATPATSALPGFLPHVNFPYLKARADGTLEAYASVGQTQSSARFGIRGLSTDGGRTWTTSTSWPSTPGSSIVRPAGQFSYGVSFAASSPSGISNWNNTRYVSTNGGNTWSFDTASFSTGSILYGSIYNNLGDLVQSGTTLFATGFGPRQGQSTFESVLFASNNNGQTWSRRSTIAAHTSAPLVGMGSEGPNETGMVQLDNGNLLAVYRTGQPFASTDINANAPPIMWSMSSDQGFTWTAPKTLGVSGVWPTLRKLDNGLIALTYGRYGAKVMFADPTGLRWTRPTVIYNGPGSGHTEMRQTALGDYAFVYDQSSFYPPAYDPFPPAGYVYDNNQSGHLKSAILDIAIGPGTDDFRWSHEYHGDAAPDALSGEGWTRSQAGSPTLNLSADLGQDFVRTISTASTSDRLSFATTGQGSAASAWQELDFSVSGAVVDVRARVVGAAAEGSADVHLGDATTGAVTMQLTGSAVHLDGAGGSGQQATFLANQIPGFLTTAWHDYRIVIGPDLTQGGIVRAAVYLDGNFTTPILTKSLDLPGALDAIEFGDRSMLAAGTMDVDFVRFSPLASEWITDASGNWHDANAWTARLPNAAGAVVRLGDAISAPRTITLDTPATVGLLRLESLNAYTIAGPGTLSLQAPAGGAAMIVVQEGGHAIAAPLAFASPTAISGSGSLALGDIAAATTLTISSTVTTGNIEGAGTLIVDSGSAVTMTRTRMRSLAVNGQAAVATGRSAGKTSRIELLSIGPVGRIDLGDNDLLIDYTGFTPRASIEALVASGYANGTWGGRGIVTSLANQGGLRALGVADASEAGIAGTYNGVPVDATTVIVRYTLAGDFNLSGGVDIADFSILAAGFNLPGRWRTGDSDYNGLVNVADFALLAANFNQAMPPTPARTVVPEPSTAAVLLAFLPLRRRR